MPEVNSVVAICNNRSQAEKAMKELQKNGFDMTKVSMARDLKTGKVLLVCDGPWEGPIKKLTSRRAHRKRTKVQKAA